MPSDLALKTMNAVHRVILTVTRGTKGWDLGGMPVLELTTTGRTSGRPRTVLLTAPLTRGDTLVVVASRGGDDHHPAWYLNLVDTPQVTVALQGGQPRPMTARVATAQERAELWPKIAGKYRNYAQYQERTSREIPLVLLEPIT